MFDLLFSNRGLSLERLKTLSDVHAAGSIAQAAPTSSSRQSQYSRQLTELGEFFGVELTARQGKQLVFTEAGERLVALTRRHFTELSDFRAVCQSEAVEYRLGAGEGALQWLVIPKLRPQIDANHPTSFATFNLRTGEIVRQLRDERLSFGILRQESVPPGIKSFTLGKVRHACVVPKALIGGGKLTLKKVVTQVPLATMTTDGQFTVQLRALAATTQTHLRTSLACVSYPQVLAAVTTGAYAAILPTMAIASLPAHQFRIFGESELAPLTRDLALAWNPRAIRLRPQSEAVLDYLKRTLTF